MSATASATVVADSTSTGGVTHAGSGNDPNAGAGAWSAAGIGPAGGACAGLLINGIVFP